MSEVLKFPSWRYKERKYVEGETAKLVKNAEEEKALGEGWFDSPAKAPDREAEQAEIQRRYWERFEAADGNPNGQALILIEYRSQHPKEAAADSWYKEVAPLIPLLQSQAQSQAILNLAADRKAEDRERRTTEAEATELRGESVGEKEQEEGRRPGRPHGPTRKVQARQEAFDKIYREYMAANNGKEPDNLAICDGWDSEGILPEDGYSKTWHKSYFSTKRDSIHSTIRLHRKDYKERTERKHHE